VAFYERRGFRDGGWGDETDEVSTFLGLDEPVEFCVRLAARLASCLYPPWDMTADAPAETPQQQVERLVGYLACRDKAEVAVGRAVLEIALGAADDTVFDAVLHSSKTDATSLSAAVAALHVLADYTTGCFNVPGLTVADVVHEVATLPPSAFAVEG
jgi:hypothetical protein